MLSQYFKFRNDLRAFTLAEVLITLTVIGVVAAITIPVINNTVQDIQYKTAYKKAYSVVSQAWQSAIGDNLIVNRSGGWCDAVNNSNFIALKSRFKISKDCGLGDGVVAGCWQAGGDTFYGSPNNYVNSFIDESGMNWGGAGSICGAIIVDTNGFKSPNQFGKDRMALMMGQSVSSIILDRISPWGDAVGINADCCPKGSCYYTKWLYN